MSGKLDKINWVCYPNKKIIENFSNNKQNEKKDENTLKSYLISNNIIINKNNDKSYFEENRLF